MRVWLVGRFVGLLRETFIGRGGRGFIFFFLWIIFLPYFTRTSKQASRAGFFFLSDFLGK